MEATITEDEIGAANALLQLTQKPQGTTLRSISTQTPTASIIVNPRNRNFLPAMKTIHHLSAFTGLASFELFEGIAAASDHYVQYRLCEEDTYLLDSRNRLLMVFMKMKNNPTYLLLSTLFDVSPQTCSRYLEKNVFILRRLLENFIRWPSRSAITKNLPRCFAPFQATRVVVDGSEIPVCRLPCVLCRLQTFSHYKSRHTLKFLLFITPSGHVSYISCLYGGKASDKFIFSESNILDMCEEGDAVMCDKGFLIERECAGKKVTMIRPPFKKKNQQLPAEECKKNVKIAEARIHVERCIERFKHFRILTEEVDWHILPLMDEMLVIIGAIVNLSSPILSEKAFL